MQTFELSRDITIKGILVAAGTIVKASFVGNEDKTLIIVDGVGHKFFQCAPIRY